MMWSGPLVGNFAYIDNQNMFMSALHAPEPWQVDMRKFRVYLSEKYNVVKAYLFMGAYEAKRQDLYITFQECGYVLVFREHSSELKGKKKGNVDVDVAFEMMRDMFTSAQMEKAILVSGDGDYYRIVQYMIDVGKFERILLPSHHNASSLYKRLSDERRSYMDSASMKRKIGK